MDKLATRLEEITLNNGIKIDDFKDLDSEGKAFYYSTLNGSESEILTINYESLTPTAIVGKVENVDEEKMEMTQNMIGEMETPDSVQDMSGEDEDDVDDHERQVDRQCLGTEERGRDHVGGRPIDRDPADPPSEGAEASGSGARLPELLARIVGVSMQVGHQTSLGEPACVTSRKHLRHSRAMPRG